MDKMTGEEIVAVPGDPHGHGKVSIIKKCTNAIVVILLIAYFPISQPSPEHEALMPASSPFGEKPTKVRDLIGGYFTENRGQVDGLISYYSVGNPIVGFRDDGVSFSARQVDERGTGKVIEESISPVELPDHPGHAHYAKSFDYFMRFENSNPVSAVGRSRLPFNSNFFIGNDSNKWRTDVPNFREVVYANLYDGIDLAYFARQIGVKYEFVVGTGADPNSILISYEGIESLRAEGENLFLNTPLGVMQDSELIAYQNSRQPVDCSFVLRGAFSYGFSCGEWDRSQPLVIDPLIYATYLGGGAYDSVSSVAADDIGNAYVTGFTESADFPVTPGALSENLDGPDDAFVAKLDVTGSSFLYVTYLGGTASGDNGISIAIDPFGHAYVTGITRSPDFPWTPGAFDTSFGGSADAFIVKLNLTGSALEYSTFLGGMGDDMGLGITVDVNGRAITTGWTKSADFPITSNAFDMVLDGGLDAYAAKLDPFGMRLEYSTFIGGTGGENAFSIAMDNSGGVYVCGETTSSDFPVTSTAFDMSLNGIGDAFVVKLNSTGELEYATYLGGRGDEYASAVVSDSLGNAYLAGVTFSSDFPATPGAFDNAFNGSSDAFIAKLNSAGSALVYATLLGGGGDDVGGKVALDAFGNVYATGITNSADFPTTSGSLDSDLNGSYDIFFCVLTVDGAALVYSTYLGGDGYDHSASIARNAIGDIFLSGDTDSTNFPVTPGAFDTGLSGPDGFVAKLSVPLPPSVADLAVSPSDIVLSPLPPYEDGATVQLNATIRNIGGNYTQSTSVRFEDGVPPSLQIGAEQPLPPISAAGSRNVSVIWTASHPGIHQICVVADPDNILPEADESNNIACVPAEVLSPPDLVPVNLGVIPPSPLQYMTVAQVNVTTRNEGASPAGGFDTLFFDDLNANGMPDGGESIGFVPVSGLIGHSQTNISVNWTAAPLGAHSICAYVDPPPDAVAESNETNNIACIDVLVQSGPILRPDYVPSSPLPLPPIRVGMSSQVSLSIQVLNQGNGTATDNAIVAFHEQSSPPFSTFVLSPLAPANTSTRIDAIWISPAIPGTYSVSVDVDYDNNVSEWDETNNVYTWTMEVVSGPLTSLVIGSPNYTSPAMTTYVKSTTLLDLSVLDQSGLGIRNTTYRIVDGSPVNYTATGTFNLAGEGVHEIEWQSLDWAGNLEEVNSMNLTVDDTSPATAVHQSEEQATAATVFTLTATDVGCGVNVTWYRIDGGNWTAYSGGFTLPEGAHNISYYSNDMLNNTEAEKWLVVTVEGTTTPPVEVTVNYKPIVAVIFAIILILAGVWSSRRRPWKGGKGRMAVVKAFMIFSISFVLAEAGTGAVSLLTGLLSMPPLLGAGTAIDLAVLTAGLVISLLRAFGTGSREPAGFPASEKRDG